MIGKGVRGAAILMASSTWIAGSGANAQEPVRKPAFSHSVADQPPGRQVQGPLFTLAKQAIAAANARDGAAFQNFVAADARMTLMYRPHGSTKPETKPFTAEAIRAATDTCFGPYSYDEGVDWAQLSWICRTDAGTPLSKFIQFQDSPELSLTVHFEGGKIKNLSAMEPLWIPGRKLIAMDAYNAVRPKN